MAAATPVVAGDVVDVSHHPDHGRAEIRLEIQCDDGESGGDRR